LGPGGRRFMNPIREIGSVVGLKQLWVLREIDFSHSQLSISTAPLRTLCNSQQQKVRNCASAQFIPELPRFCPDGFPPERMGSDGS